MFEHHVDHLQPVRSLDQHRAQKRASIPTCLVLTRRLAHERDVEPERQRLLTATPFREDDRPLDGTIVLKYPLKLAQKEGYFRAIHFEPIIESDPKRSDEKIALKAVECLRRDFERGHVVMARIESVPRAKQVFELYRPYQEFNPVQLHTDTDQVCAGHISLLCPIHIIAVFSSNAKRQGSHLRTQKCDI